MAGQVTAIRLPVTGPVNVWEDGLGGLMLTLESVTLTVPESKLWTPRANAGVRLVEGARITLRGTAVDAFLPYQLAGAE